MTDLAWTKRTLADILGDKSGLPDWMAEAVAKFTDEDLAELRRNEREVAFDAFKRVAHQSRNVRGTDAAWVEGDIDWGLRAARSALEAVPAGERSEKATELLADCTCPAATGPNPGMDTATPGTDKW